MKQKAIVLTNGCPENRIDGARIEQFLLQNGWNMTRNIAGSDLMIFNACGLTEFAQEESINIIRQLNKKMMRNSRLVVCGCLPKINSERIQEIFNGDIFEGDDTQKLTNILGIKHSSNGTHANYLIPHIGEFKREIKCSQSLTRRFFNFTDNLNMYKIQTRRLRNKYLHFWDTANIVQPDTYYIKISSGCLNSCSYCAVKLSRGSIKSKSIEQIKKEFLKGLESGYKQFALIGTDSGSYGMDIQTDLVKLLKEMISVEGEYQLKLRNVHPRALIKMLPEFLSVFQSGKIVHMTTATQHGNNRILKLMKRGYKIEDFKYAINTVKRICPKLKIRTQFMVGFPGETDAEFTDTLNLLDEIKFDFIEIYTYSPRPNTIAAVLPNKVTSKTADKRHFMLLKKVLDHLNSGACYN